MAQEVRVDPLGDLGICGRLFDDLLDAMGRVWRVLDRLEEIAGRTMQTAPRPLGSASIVVTEGVADCETRYHKE